MSDERELSLRRSNAGLYGTGHLSVECSHITTSGLHAVLLVVLRFEDVPLWQGMLHLYAVSLDEFQQTLGPNLSQTFGTIHVGMQIEVACITTLASEERPVVLEVFPNSTIACIDLVVLFHNGIKHGIVAAKAVQAFLQILRAIIRTGAVPDGIVEQNLASRYFLYEFIDNCLDVVAIDIWRHRCTFRSCAGAVVRA